MNKYDNLNCSEIFSSKRFYSILYSYAIMTENYCKTEPPYAVRKCDYSTSILEDKKQGFKFIEFFKFGFSGLQLVDSTEMSLHHCLIRLALVKNQLLKF